MTTVRYLRAEEWGMRWARPPVAERLLDPEVYVHHRAGSRGGPDAAAAFRAMNEGAIRNKGYSATDYDFLVHYWEPTDTLTIGEARGKWLSAATRDRNEEGEAICVLGYFHPGHALSEQPHPMEIEGVALAIKWAIDLGFVARDARILGHRDNPRHPGATGCPGDYLYAHMGTIRQRVALLLAGPQPPEIVPPVEVPQMSAIDPVRLMDTRPLGGVIPADTVVTVASAANRPTWARSAVVNVTVVQPVGPGFVTLWQGGPRPATSNVNYDFAGHTSHNLAVVPLDADGEFVFSPEANGCHVIIDQQGWAQ